jgi:hypothetical protein
MMTSLDIGQQSSKINWDSHIPGPSASPQQLAQMIEGTGYAVGLCGKCPRNLPSRDDPQIWDKKGLDGYLEKD